MKSTNPLEVNDSHNEVHWLILQQIDALSKELDLLVEADTTVSSASQPSSTSTLFVRSKSALRNKNKVKKS